MTMKKARRSNRGKKKRARHTGTESAGGDDRLSDLPDSILLYIMSFMMIKDAVQTCILSKRWKDLWKGLLSLTLHTSDFMKPALFSEFVCGIVSCRDGEHPLHNLDFNRHGYFQPQILISLMKYAVSHGIQILTIDVPYNIRLPSFIYSCQSLTSLDISVSPYDVKRRTRIPKSLELPALVSMHLTNVAFSTNENREAEPFLTCKKLNTLSIDRFSLFPRHSDKEKQGKLIISNAKLANLTIGNDSGRKIVVSAPNLSSFIIDGSPFQTCRQAKVNIELQSSSLK